MVDYKMESELKFTKEGDNIVLYDKNVYTSLDDIQQLYNTFKAMALQRSQTRKQVENQLEQLKEEEVIANNRFNQIKEFLQQEGVEVDEQGVTLE